MTAMMMMMSAMMRVGYDECGAAADDGDTGDCYDGDDDDTDTDEGE